MTAQARRRLAHRATSAGYPPALLTAIAKALLPRYRPGDRLTTTQLEHIADAVDVLSQAGYGAARLTDILADDQCRHGEGWRQRFWTRALTAAAARQRHAERHRLLPSEMADSASALGQEPTRAQRAA